jgi:hypothetical protein
MFVLHLRSAALCRAMVPVLMVDAGSGEADALRDLLEGLWCHSRRLRMPW